MSEDTLVLLLTRFARGEMAASFFVEQYMSAWRTHRDSRSPSTRATIFDAAFTAADCYSADPTQKWEISGEQLRKEVAELASQLTTNSV